MMGGGMAVWMLLGTIIFLTVAVLGGARLIRELMGRPDRLPVLRDGAAAQLQGAEEPSALEKAQERYVRGEIDHAEFERLLDQLLNDQRTSEDR
jgi:uncharacterized membrane protein